jgi:hypothetical protein
MKEELKWVRSNAKGRQSKSKARLARFEELSDVDYQKRNETNEIFIPVGERLGNQVIDFNGVSKSFGDRLLIDNLSFKVPAGEVAFQSSNGWDIAGAAAFGFRCHWINRTGQAGEYFDLAPVATFADLNGLLG